MFMKKQRDEEHKRHVLALKQLLIHRLAKAEGDEQLLSILYAEKDQLNKQLPKEEQI